MAKWRTDLFTNGCQMQLPIARHLASTSGVCLLGEAVAGISTLRKLNAEVDHAVLAACGWAIDDGVIERSPLERMKRAKGKEPDRQNPTWEQVQRLAAAAGRLTGQPSIVAKLMQYFGVGQTEIKHLCGEHVELVNSKVHFRRKKAGKSFELPTFFDMSQRLWRRFRLTSAVIRPRKRCLAGRPSCATIQAALSELRALQAPE